MKTLYFPKKLILILLALSIPLVDFAQCTVSSTILFENFNYTNPVDLPGTETNCGSGGMGTSWRTTTLPAGQTKGQYETANCSGRMAITNDAEMCESHPADLWKDQTNTGYGGGVGNYALMVDACGDVQNGSVWCTSITVTTGQTYNFSAFFSSPWLQEKENDPDVYFNIDGVRVGPSLLVEQYTSSGPTPYQSFCSTYTIPAPVAPVLATRAVDFCIHLRQRTGGSSGSPGSGTFGPNGQGNDVLIDDIKIDRVTGAGCTSGSACSSTPTPVELIIFDAKTLSGNRAFLHWTTATEKNTDYFSVEKSQDGLNFTETGTVKARGNSSTIANYEYSDFQFNETSYYRLKIIDIDGSYEYSMVRFLEKDEHARVIHNLENGQLEIKAMVAEDTQWNISVYSLLGQVYSNENVQLTKGENVIVKGINNESQISRIVRITDSNGKVILSSIIVW